jgi:hypothetical protein
VVVLSDGTSQYAMSSNMSTIGLAKLLTVLVDASGKSMSSLTFMLQIAVSGLFSENNSMVGAIIRRIVIAPAQGQLPDYAPSVLKWCIKSSIRSSGWRFLQCSLKRSLRDCL